MLIVLVFMGVFYVGLGNWLIVRLWKNRPIGSIPAIEVAENTYFYLSKPRSRRAAVRALPVTLVGVDSMWCVLVWDELISESIGPFTIAAFTVFFTCLLSVMSITLFNRPKFLVPPARRSDTGVLVEWFRERKAADE